MIERLTRVHAKIVLSRIMADARDATRVQARVLLRLLRSTSRGEYGQSLGFSRIRNYREFTERVPIATYADLSPWVERVRGGDVSALFNPGTRIHMFAMSSGTTDKPKYVPVTDRFLKDTRAGWMAFGVKALSDHRRGELMHSVVQVASPMDEERSLSNIPCGAVTGLMAATQRKVVRRYYAVPSESARITDTQARRYVSMRFSMPIDIGWIVAASPATILQLAHTGEEHAESLIRDIRDGTLDNRLDIPSDVRASLEARLKPAPAAAKRLNGILETQGRLRPRDYWDLRFIANWTGGTMGLYLRDYPEYFGCVPVRDIGLLATEGRMSIPIADGTPAGVAAVSTVFLEFIPAEEYGNASPTVLRTHEVEFGREYFILITTSAGFYRYDICDCVRVVGFEGQAPLIEFLHKGSHVSSLTGEKLTEHQVVMGLDEIATKTGCHAKDVVLAPRWGHPPHYRLYLECPEHRDANWTKKVATELDGQLKRINCEYASKRNSERLGPIDACVVAAGTLADRDAQRATLHRKSNEQFKHKYLLTEMDEDASLARLAVCGAVASE